MKKQLLVDMDGVLADVYAQFLRMEYEEAGIRQTPEDLNGKTEPEAFVYADKHVRSKGFFRTAPVMEGSVEGLRYLNEKYKVYIVSSATEYPNSLLEKHEWLNEHFPFITWQQMIFCGSKEPVRGDLMIDDHPKNLDHFEGTTFLFTQPHNFFIQNPKHVRVNNWDEIRNLL